MVGKEVVTAYSDAESAQAIREIARAESRSVAQVAGAALKLYALLSRDVRSALRELEGDEEAFRHLVNRIAGVVRADRFDAAAHRVAQSLPTNASVPEDEDAILAMAVDAVDGQEIRP
ncbi:hypothetical protein [Gloeobacter morelensis]|uniref:Ribbon-helix-helix protein CopG domain-containing protein n=1 Tax=Gloeobacter morelensis MG652769 TaxID=2781736 RepID=A0ABY3PNH9_9CYAN|nr:hypothetical protein [Gloeobacter morelensis]UFP95255.1 hypothetical protein ISF26_03105 [Gloeobacter morelensis MG652769]